MTDMVIYNTDKFKIFEKLFQEEIVGFSFYEFIELETNLIEDNYKEVKITVSKKTLENFCKIYLEYIERENNG